MSEEKNGMTIREFKSFINSLPLEFDGFTIVNGEVAAVEGQFYVRIDKPVVQISVDEETQELLILHQTEDEVNDIMNQLNNGDSEGN